MKRDAGDVVDRYSIAKLKQKRIGGFEAKLEAADFYRGFFDLKRKYPGMRWKAVLLRMSTINGDIWDLESELRQGSIDDDVLQCGKIAVQVRKINAKRVAFKNYINRALEQGVQDVKQNHISEGTPEDFITFEEFCAWYVLPRRNGTR